MINLYSLINTFFQFKILIVGNIFCSFEMQQKFVKESIGSFIF